jgi:hypothetical protein
MIPRRSFEGLLATFLGIFHRTSKGLTEVCRLRSWGQTTVICSDRRGILAFCNITQVICVVVPFANALELGIHFRKHGHKFGHRTAVEYEKAADAFMFDPMNANTRECVRPNGRRRCRLETVAAHFGVAVVGRKFLITFYPPSPGTIRSHGGMTAYFAHECARNA